MTGSILLVVQKSCHFASGQLILKGHVDRAPKFELTRTIKFLTKSFTNVPIRKLDDHGILMKF